MLVLLACSAPAWTWWGLRGMTILFIHPPKPDPLSPDIHLVPTSCDETSAPEPRLPSRANNFDFLRLSSAILVIFSHAYPIVTGRQNTEFLNWWTHERLSFGSVAVSVFFLISGYLITQSWERCRGAGEYFRRRVCRIDPGFMVAFLLYDSVVLPLSSSKPAACFTQDNVARMTVLGDLPQ